MSEDLALDDLGTWLSNVTRAHSPRIVHVTPLGDLRKHSSRGTGERCWCGATVERFRVGDRRRVGLVVRHNSADGRELVEEHGVQ